MSWARIPEAIISDVADLLQAIEFSPHKHRSQERKGRERQREYLEWSRDVIAACCGCNPRLEAFYDEPR